MQVITLAKAGAPSSFKIKEVEDPKITKNDILIKQTAIGVNFFDIAFRSGQYKLPQTPVVLGLEACGTVERVGSAVKDFKVGDRVAYATGGLGAYATKRAINQDFAIAVPDYISDEQAVAVLYKGLMAHALLHRVYIAKRAQRIMVTSVTGGVGHILCQWAKFLELEVIGLIGMDGKREFAKNIGCDLVINYKQQNVVDEVAKATKNTGDGVVYDAVGKETLESSISCLWPMGMCVSFGESSGSYESLNLNRLVTNSLYLTRPTMSLYKANRVELVLSANEVFGAVQKGIIKPKITSFNFKDVSKAHELIESKKSMGSIVLKI